MSSPFPLDSDRDRLWRACSRFWATEVPPAADSGGHFRHRLLAKTIMKTERAVRGPMVEALKDCFGCDFAACCLGSVADYAVGMPLVPLKNPNGHNYELGTAVIYGTPEGGNSCFKLSAAGELRAGNNLPGDGPDNKVVRLATADELRALLERADDAAAHKLLLLLAAVIACRDEGAFPFDPLSLADKALAKLTAEDAPVSPAGRRRPARRPGDRDRACRPAPESADDPFAL